MMTAFELATRYIGIHELAKGDHPLIQWWLSLCNLPTDIKDETPWCSAFVNGIAWELRLPRSKSAAARSSLRIGQVIALEDAKAWNDIVILKRGGDDEPGPEVIQARGHVGYYAGRQGDSVMVLGGNQGDSVCVLPFPPGRVLGVRRLSGIAA